MENACPPTRILALDVSAVCTGFAIFCIENKTVELIKLGTIKTKSANGIGKRLSSFKNELTKLINDFNIDKIIVEEIFRGPNIKTFKTLSFFHSAVIISIYELTSSEVIRIPVTTVRKIIGKSLKSKLKTKQDLFDALNNYYKLSFTFKEHNDIVDAIALGLAFFYNEEIDISGVDCKNATKSI